MAHPSLGFQRAEIIIALATMSQRILSKANTWSFSFPNVMQVRTFDYNRHAIPTDRLD